jgi:hypothetical protein
MDFLLGAASSARLRRCQGFARLLEVNLLPFDAGLNVTTPSAIRRVPLFGLSSHAKIRLLLFFGHRSITQVMPSKSSH